MDQKTKPTLNNSNIVNYIKLALGYENISFTFSKNDLSELSGLG